MFLKDLTQSIEFERPNLERKSTNHKNGVFVLLSLSLGTKRGGGGGWRSFFKEGKSVVVKKKSKFLNNYNNLPILLFQP